MRYVMIAAIGSALAGNLAFAADGSVQATANAPTKSAFGPTAVGQKAAQFRADFEKLKTNTQTRSAQLDAVREQTVRNVNAYHTLVGGIRSRLQMGSTPGNPELLAQWAQAQTQLTQIDADIATLNTLSAQVSGDAGTSSYLLENIRAAYGLSGALEEDHRSLRLLEDEVNQNAIVLTPPELGMLHDAARDYDAVWSILIGWIVATLVLLHVLGRFHKPQAAAAGRP